MNKLYIDSREHSALTDKVIETCISMNIPYEKKWLEIGDYVFGNVCFEAKSSIDFLQSVINKRLWSQLDNMDRTFVTNAVIVYGSFNEAVNVYKEHSKFKGHKSNQERFLFSKFFGGISKIMLDTDCNVIRPSTLKEAANIICATCMMQPIEREIYTPRIIKQKKINTTDLRIDVLTTIKGLSEKKAKLLIKRYGSIMEIGETSASEIEKIEGFGKTLATRVLNVLNSEDKLVI